MKTNYLVFFLFVFGAVIGCEMHSLSDYQTFNETVSKVETNIDSAEVRIAASDDETSSVDYDVTYWTDRPSIKTEVKDGTLHVTMSCRFHCDGDFIIYVPKSVSSNIVLDSGDLTVDGLQGNLSIKVDSGNMQLKNLSGELNLKADSGNIKGSVDSTKVTANVDSGNLSLFFNQKPDDLNLSVDSGNIYVDVPTGDYNIRTNIDSGREKISSLTVNENSLSRIYAEADSGNITINGY